MLELKLYEETQTAAEHISAPVLVYTFHFGSECFHTDAELCPLPEGPTGCVTVWLTNHQVEKTVRECIFLKSGNVMLWLRQSHSGAAGATTTSRYWSAGRLGLTSDQQHAVILKSVGSSDLRQRLCQRVGCSLWTLLIAAFIWVISTASKPGELVPALQAPVATLFSYFLVKALSAVF